MIEDWGLYANFTEDEMRCSHCGLVDMQPDFMKRLQRVRDCYHRPMRINSAFRCAEFDEALGGAGVHPTGQAVDVAVWGENVFRLMVAAINCDMRGLGFKQHGLPGGRYMHLDDLGGERKRPRVWTYPDK